MLGMRVKASNWEAENKGEDRYCSESRYQMERFPATPLMKEIKS